MTRPDSPIDREYPHIRAGLIQLAAALDRIDRSDVPLTETDQARLTEISRALSCLAQQSGNRAEQLQLIFSLPYDPDWKAKFGL